LRLSVTSRIFCAVDRFLEKSQLFCRHGSVKKAFFDDCNPDWHFLAEQFATDAVIKQTLNTFIRRFFLIFSTISILPPNPRLFVATALEARIVRQKIFP